MKVNVSAIKCFQRSQTEWFYRYKLRRVPRRPEEVYFSVGRWWHLAMEHLVSSGSLASTVNYADNQRLVIQAEINKYPDPGVYHEKFTDETDRLLTLMRQMPTRFVPKEVLAVEKTIEAKLPGGDHILFGRPDQVIKLHDKFWNLQYKTTSDRTSIPIFVKTRERDLHELAYAWLIAGKYCTPDTYGGTFLNIVRKLSTKAIRERPMTAFVQELVPISWNEVTRAVKDIGLIADQMDLIEKGETDPIQNRESDVNRYGNVLSPYYDVYTGQVSLFDDYLFMNVPGEDDSSPNEETE